MSVEAIAPRVYSGLKAVTILPKSKENITRPFIYNEILDITKKLRVPATFHTAKIELPEPTLAVLEKLKELGISYSKVK